MKTSPTFNSFCVFIFKAYMLPKKTSNIFALHYNRNNSIVLKSRIRDLTVESIRFTGSATRRQGKLQL